MGKLIGELELNRIYQRDCIEGIRMLPENSVDLVTTDPPYGIDYKSNWCDKFNKIVNDDSVSWLPTLFEELNRVTKEDSHIYCFTSAQYLDVFMFEIKKYWKVKNIIVIPRTMKGGLGDLHSSFSPQNEYVIFATKGRRRFEDSEILKPSEGYLKDKRKTPKEWVYRLPDYWDFVKVSEHNSKRSHPTQKTVGVMEVMVKVSSARGDVVLDPFIGSGTTAIASVRNNRNFIGFECEQEYVEIANKRLDNEETE